MAVEQLVRRGVRSTAEPGQDDVTMSPGRMPLNESDPLSDPILSGLLHKLLPPIGEPFSAAARRQLFTALAVNLDVIYGPARDGHIDWREVEKLMAPNIASEDQS